MCLAVPLKLLEVSPDGKEGTVDMGGAPFSVGLDLVPEAKPGDYVLVHAGMAIEMLDEPDANEILKTFREYARASDILAPEVDGPNG